MIANLEFEVAKYELKVEIERPSAFNYEHKYKLKAIINNLEKKAEPESPSETAGKITYSFKNIEHGTTFKFIAEEALSESKFDVEKWKYKKDIDTNFTEISILSSDKKIAEYTVEAKTTIKVILKIKIFRVNWEVEGGNTGIEGKYWNANNVEEDSITANTTPHEVQVEIDGKISLNAQSIPLGYFIKGWKVDGTIYTQTQLPYITISGDNSDVDVGSDKRNITIANVDSPKEIKLVLEKKKYRVTVKIVRPTAFASYAHNYTLETLVEGALKNADGGASTSGDVITYTFSNIEYGSNIAFSAIEATNSNFDIDKWR